MSTTVALTAEDEAKVEEVRGKPLHGVPGGDGARQRRARHPPRAVRGACRRGRDDVGRARRAAPASPSATRGSGSSSRPSPAWSRSTTSTGRGDERRFTLPNAHAHVLLDDDSEACMKPCAAVVPWARRRRSTSWSRSSAAAPARRSACSTCTTSRPRSRGRCSSTTSTQTGCRRCPTSRRSSTRGEPVRIAEVGCGEGLAAITIATRVSERRGRRLRPRRRVDRGRAGGRGRGAASPIGPGSRCATRPIRRSRATTTWCMAIEMLHDVPDPVGILRTMRGSPASAARCSSSTNGPRRRSPCPASEMERFFYAFSTLHCLAVSMQDGGVGHRDGHPARHRAALRGRRRLLDRRRARRRPPAVPPLSVDLTSADCGV